MNVWTERRINKRPEGYGQIMIFRMKNSLHFEEANEKIQRMAQAGEQESKRIS